MRLIENEDYFNHLAKRYNILIITPFVIESDQPYEKETWVTIDIERDLGISHLRLQTVSGVCQYNYVFFIIL